MNKPKLGVSACLLGHPVRYDGGHKRQRFITDTLTPHFELVPVCPETAIGLGTPRPTIRLQQIDGRIRLVNSRDVQQDHTAQMQQFAQQQRTQCSTLDGFILKKDSPSCGMARVPVVTAQGRQRHGIGVFAEQMMKLQPLLPVEEEGRLNDPGLRQNFFERVYAHQRWRDVLQASAGNRARALRAFHQQHKLLLMARTGSGRGSGYVQLGQIIAELTSANAWRVSEIYIEKFMQVMEIQPTHGRQVNVLQHILGFMKGQLDGPDKQELLQVFDAYRHGQIPLITPLTLLRHHLRRLSPAWVMSQHYLKPFPDELGLLSANSIQGRQ